ncbi:ribonuclease III domain-containing protein [Lasiosphaeria hispida]|uniref:Ribonuclease III domain-containing protein n=1 Tax=Lasiosphaeria hispida TaxID=260671 RepID=A0AAJ0H8R6_9PEZI|nr:ribonuclease III domain-containing protein [Lasiosphaeria hispida]
MGKRSHSEAIQPPQLEADNAVPSLKRAKPATKKVANKSQKNDPKAKAITLLLENADELIDCLQSLKTKQLGNSTQPDKLAVAAEDAAMPTTIQRLSSLGNKLVSAFEMLGKQPVQETRSETQTAKEYTVPIFPPSVVTKWTAADTRQTFPPLPAVLDPKLETAALTHSGKLDLPADEMSYERLEWMGDVYIEVIASALIYQTFPTLPPGRSSQLREICVRNTTLSQFSLHYGLDKRADFPEEFGLGGRAGGTKVSQKQRIKALGDIFESYVGAIIISDPKDGVQRAAKWLKALWAPLAEKHILKEEASAPEPERKTLPKTDLEVAIGGKSIKLEYKEIAPVKKHRDHDLDLYTMGCFLTGWGEVNKQIGFGSALGKKEAGQKAAQMALDNKKLIKVYREKKLQFLAARAQQLKDEEKS